MPWLCPSWFKFLILNVVLRVFRRKKSIFFPCRTFLSCVVDEMFIDVPWFRENSPALKNSWLHSWYQYLYYHIDVIYLHSKKCNSFFKKKTQKTSKRLVLSSKVLFVCHFLLTKNLPKDIFETYILKYKFMFETRNLFSWNSYKKNFLMLSKNLLDSREFFLTLRHVFFNQEFIGLKQEALFLKQAISNFSK